MKIFFHFRYNSLLTLTLAFMVSLFPMKGMGHSQMDSRIHKLFWDGLEVVWLEDDRFPSYNLSFYFADGASSDAKGLEGETELMFQQLKSGTRKYDQKQISDILEFYGVSVNQNVSHEYSLFGFSGLVKDIVPTMNMVCHLLKDSIFPTAELSKVKDRHRSSLLSITSSPSALADRAFRKLSLKGTTYEMPTDGSLETVEKIQPQNLQEKLKYFNQSVKKRLYISGPKEILAIRKIIHEDCGLNFGTSQFSRISPDQTPKSSPGPQFYLIPLPSSNQAQIRIGRFLAKKEVTDPDLMNVTSTFLGGGFTSKLMQELRVKRGLTYGVGAVASPQRDYGRVLISTFTKNESLIEALQVIKRTLEQMGKGKFSSRDLKKTTDYLSGRYLFGFEKSSALLGNLLFLDHLQRDYKELFDFPEKIKVYHSRDVAQMVDSYFDWKKQTIVIVGDEKLKSSLEKLGKVQIVSFDQVL